MNWLLIVNIIIISISISILLYGSYISNEDLKFSGYIATFFSILVGFGVIGLTIPISHKTKIVNVQLTKTNKSIILEDYNNDNVYFFNKKIDFNNIKDTTTFYLNVPYNMYNVEEGKKYIYYIINGRKYKGEIRWYLVGLY